MEVGDLKPVLFLIINPRCCFMRTKILMEMKSFVCTYINTLHQIVKQSDRGGHCSPYILMIYAIFTENNISTIPPLTFTEGNFGK